MKVTTDGCLFGAWCAEEIENENTENKNILDIGTGTGLLSLMIAQKNDMAIDAVEIEPEAASRQGKMNCRNRLSTDQVVHSRHIKFYQSGLYDYIISNPPFYENELTLPSLKTILAHHDKDLDFKRLLKIIDEKLKLMDCFFCYCLIKEQTKWKHC